MMIFDCNCIIGRRTLKGPLEPWKKEELLAQMARCGVERALVSHAVSIEYDPVVGNKLLTEELEDAANLAPVWVAMPHETGSVPPPNAFLGEMKQEGARAVALYPKTHGFPFDRYACGELLGALQKCKVPVFLNLRESGYGVSPDKEQVWSGIRAVLHCFPALRLVVTNLSNWGMDRYFFPLLEEYPELRLETSTLRTQMGMETICKRFGPDRLLFGSGWPTYAPGASLAMLNYALVADEVREQIAGLTLRRLLEEVQFP